MTKLANLDFIPEVFAGYVDAGVRKESRALNSGLVADASVLFPAYGSIVTVPAWNGLEGTADILSDTTPAVANAINSTAQVATILQRVKKYSASDLAASFAGSDPLQNLGAKVAKFWSNELDRTALAALVGAAQGLGAVNDQSAAAGAITAEMIIDTRALMGEYIDEAGIMIVHPNVLAKLQKMELTSVRPGADGQLITMYQGMQVINSSTLAPAAGVYTTIIARPGAVGYADGTNPAHVFEEGREIGFGDVFSTQKRFVLHPAGAKFDGTPAAATASNAELATAANWELGAADLYSFGARVLTHKIA